MASKPFSPLGFWAPRLMAFTSSDSSYSSNYLCTGIWVAITASFHPANVFGAAKTAEYANQASRERILTPYEKRLCIIWFLRCSARPEITSGIFHLQATAWVSASCISTVASVCDSEPLYDKPPPDGSARYNREAVRLG